MWVHCLCVFVSVVCGVLCVVCGVWSVMCGVVLCGVVWCVGKCYTACVVCACVYMRMWCVNEWTRVYVCVGVCVYVRATVCPEKCCMRF